ncbi:MAG: hypothetical protein KC931_06445 [Candidatus Omnitrophica bacterium]|nr:hypothetical protein [Candidatus Omnitrophota bacterium]MCA9436513.1 hypothetical protein [Candidatus Omnitrophota bacterium]MCA9446734.1 hypothetical protein [Candidatus Omnitrophota bacterium]MCB9767109.1 hypothetical protein [Candidatus Omnitrophota bacterium]
MKRLLILLTAILSTLPIPFAMDPAASEGVPLPGITLYGRIDNMEGTSRLTSGILQVRLTPQGGETVTLVSQLMNFGGEFSYVLRVPVELAVAGETLSDNAVALPGTTINYEIAANISDTALSLQGGTTSYSFSPDEHRGSVRRIDMQATDFVAVPEDANGDGMVKRDDLLYWFEAWMDTIPEKFDFDGSGRVDGPDLVHLLESIREAEE